MIDAATLAQMNGEYVMPSDAGPAWRAAAAYGYDMSLLEEMLALSPEQRLERHQRALDMILMLTENQENHAAK